MSEEIIVKEKENIKEWNKTQLDLIKRTVAKGATDDEFNMFMYLAKTYQLDPINKEIWFIKYSNQPPIIMTSRDGYLAIANRNLHYEGLLSDVVHENDEFEKMPDGTVKHKYGCKNRGAIIGAYALGYRDDRKYPVYIFAHIEEYDKGKGVWEQYKSAMILKVAEAMMLKRLFSISGLVTKEEIAIEKEDGTIEVSDITPEADRIQKMANKVAEGIKEQIKEGAKSSKVEAEVVPATKEQKDKLILIMKDKDISEEQLVWLKKVIDKGVSYDVAKKVIDMWEENKKKAKEVKEPVEDDSEPMLPNNALDKKLLIDEILEISKTKNIPRSTLKVWAGITAFDRLQSCEVITLKKVLDFAKKYEEEKAIE